MLTVATNYFDLTPDERLKVIIDDGIKFLKRAAQMGESYDAILFDVDSKDPTIGMSCPPTEFVAVDVLSAVKTLLKPYGNAFYDHLAPPRQRTQLIFASSQAYSF